MDDIRLRPGHTYRSVHRRVAPAHVTARPVSQPVAPPQPQSAPNAPSDMQTVSISLNLPSFSMRGRLGRAVLIGAAIMIILGIGFAAGRYFESHKPPPVAGAPVANLKDRA